jgi:hypothetical protein
VKGREKRRKKEKNRNRKNGRWDRTKEKIEKERKTVRKKGTNVWNTVTQHFLCNAFDSNY